MRADSFAARLVDPGPPALEALDLAEQLGLSFTMAALLRRRGFDGGESTERFLEPKLAHLAPPAGLAGLAAAVARLRRAVETGERIVLFGDYDCDGITSVALLTEVIHALGGWCQPRLANRFEGGYGLSRRAYERLRADEPSLLVLCDCGSSDGAQVAQARAHGIDVVIVDHHEVPADPPPAEALVNPHQRGCSYPDKGLAACGLTLLVAAGLRAALAPELDLRRWLDLCAVGTVADVVPLAAANRILVRAGLAALASSPRPGLRALLGRARRKSTQPVTAELVAFQIAPRLNAPGRLGDPRAALELLLATDEQTASGLVAEIEVALRERRRIQQTMLAEALAQVTEGRYGADPGLVLASPGWHPGVVGIVAGRLAEEVGVPTVVIALDGEVGRGSVRAPEGFDVHAALGACAAELTSFGGHRAAAGVELGRAGLERFRRRWLEACAGLGRATPAAPTLVAEARLDERDDLAAVVRDLGKLEPCGHGNPAPRLLVGPTLVRSARPVKDHLQLDLEWRGRRLRGFAPGCAPAARDLAGRTLDFVGQLRQDGWLGGGAAELLVQGWAAR